MLSGPPDPIRVRSWKNVASRQLAPSEATTLHHEYGLLLLSNHCEIRFRLLVTLKNHLGPRDALADPVRPRR